MYSIMCRAHNSSHTTSASSVTRCKSATDVQETVACINELLMRAIAHPVPRKPPGRFGFVSPTYTQSKDVAWEYLKSYSRPFFLSETPNESELRVDL